MPGRLRTTRVQAVAFYLACEDSYPARLRSQDRLSILHRTRQACAWGCAFACSQTLYPDRAVHLRLCAEAAAGLGTPYAQEGTERGGLFAAQVRREMHKVLVRHERGFCEPRPNRRGAEDAEYMDNPLLSALRFFDLAASEVVTLGRTPGMPCGFGVVYSRAGELW